jgi:hypothetical protein
VKDFHNPSKFSISFRRFRKGNDLVLLFFVFTLNLWNLDLYRLKHVCENPAPDSNGGGGDEAFGIKF